MKYYFRLFSIVIFTLPLVTCYSTRNFEREWGWWVGKDWETFRRASPPPDGEIRLENGNIQYSFDFHKPYGRKLPDSCIFYYEVDSQTGKIVKFRHEGNRCEKSFPRCAIA